MNLPEIRQPYGYTSFCDDIRYEVDGKFSLIGVYFGTWLGVGEYPSVVPRLSLFSHYFHPISVPFVDARITVTFTSSEGVMVLHQDEVRAPAPSLQPFDDLVDIDDRVYGAAFTYNLTNFVLSNPGILKVRVVSEARTVKIGSLVMRLAHASNPLEAKSG